MALPVVASSAGSIGVGNQRVLLAIVDLNTNEFLASPDIEATATLRDEFGSPLGEYPMQFVWTVPNVRGLYSVYFDIPEPATYQVTIDAGMLGDLGPIGLVAVADPLVISFGDDAPRSDTRTSAGQDLSQITSDPDPDPSFYELSVAEAIASGPSVIVFATPAWCISESCGPLLEQVKSLAPGYPGVGFVHVEIYGNLQVQSFDDLELVPAVVEWGLPSEPWVFVIDRDGVVTASFEGAASDLELETAIGAVAP